MYQEDSFKTSQVVYAHTRSDEADMEYKMHCHNSYEIYYMVKGNVEYFLEGTSYVPKPGSLLIIPPNCFHGLRVLDGSEYHRIRLHFVPELLTEKEKQLLLGILGKSWWYMEEQFRAEWYFNSLEECGSYSRELQDIAIRARIVSFLTYLSAMYEKGVGRGPGKEDVAQEILRYITGASADPDRTASHFEPADPFHSDWRNRRDRRPAGIRRTEYLQYSADAAESGYGCYASGNPFPDTGNSSVHGIWSSGSMLRNV